jgi:acetyl-CoA carboxylase biotin carboxyl carrier protein
VVTGANGRSGTAEVEPALVPTEQAPQAAQPAQPVTPDPQPAAPGLDEVIDGTARLLELVRRSPVTRLSLAVGSVRWEIDAGVPGAGPAAVADAVPARSAAPAAPTEPEAAHGHRVLAPLVGVFYTAPRPGAPAFVRVGDQVQVGQQLGIVEAMKMMNEIVADRPGIVREVNVANEAIVEFGEVLFTLEPIEP